MDDMIRHKMIRIPDCCAMPLNGKVGDTYVCVTCGTVYRHLIQGWALDGPMVELAPELNPEPAWTPSGPDDPAGFGSWPARRPSLYRNMTGEELPPYMETLDEQERTGN